jgi:hypothetical protein
MAKETKPPKNDPPGEEGPRSFGVVLHKMADGAVEAELSRELFALTKAIKDEARVRGDKVKGTLALKLTVEAEGEDSVVTVNYDVTVKAPKPQRRKGHFWFTQGGNLTSQAPKQTGLPFQDVANTRGIPNDLPLGDGDNAREA